MKKLNLQQFNQVYQLFEKAFIPAELRPYEQMKTLYNHNEFQIYTRIDNEQLIAAMIVWEFDEFVYFENFAVDQKFRGQGIGSQFLKELQRFYADKLLILEVEKPFDEISEKRIQFYQRHQWKLNPYEYIQPLLRENEEDVHLQLMSYPNQINNQQFQNIKNTLFKYVYKRRSSREY